VSDFDDHDWVHPDVLPDWSDIHDNVLSEARRTAASIYDQTTPTHELVHPDGPKGLKVGGEHIGAADFMRKVGFDARFIVMTTTWLDEYRSTVERLVHVYIAEVVSSLEALRSAENEEITYDG
jgi:hypothetical protein